MEKFKLHRLPFLFSWFILILSGTGQCANILFYFGVSSYSHRIAVWPLVEELAERGHQVIFMSPFPPRKPNSKVKEITPKALNDLMEGGGNNTLEYRLQGKRQVEWDSLPSFGKSACEIILKSTEAQELVKSSKFDLIVIDGLFNECGLGLAYVFKAKVILYSTTSVTMWVEDMIGNVPETSWITQMNHFFKEPMTFVQKVHNTLSPLYWHFWVREWNYLPELTKIVRKELNVPEMPGIGELEKSTSLVFFNSHYSIEYGRSLPPIYVPVGGLHLVESKSNKNSLPQDILKFLEESDAGGVIYVSFGTYAKASTLPPEIKSVFYEVFGSFKSIRFIWKFDIERPKDLPENVLAATWVPQQELLAHKKVKAFISHGGLLGIQEATYLGVPMIVFPLFAEQDYNANLIEKIGCGIKLEIIGIQKEQLRDAITRITTDNRYESKMMEISTLFNDRPRKPLETAIWWVEYVLRHNDVSALKPLSMYQIWYQRRLLDVWLFVFTSVLLSISFVIYILSKCFCREGSSSKMNVRAKKAKRA